MGDLVSATLGWYVTALLHLAGCPWLVIVWTAVSEAVLVCTVYSTVQYRCTVQVTVQVWYMRDCGLLICIQLMCPIKVLPPASSVMFI